MVVRDKPPRYHAYLLRFWEVRSEYPDRPPAWRFSLVDAQTRQKRGFPDLETLVAFLRAKMEENAAGMDSTSGAERE